MGPVALFLPLEGGADQSPRRSQKQQRLAEGVCLSQVWGCGSRPRRTLLNLGGSWVPASLLTLQWPWMCPLQVSTPHWFSKKNDDSGLWGNHQF